MRVLTLALLLAALGGCKKEDPPTLGGAAPSASTAPVDHLAPGELAEGKEKAFALVLPHGVSVEHSFVDVVFARGAVSADPLSNYVRSRVRDGKVTVGAGRTVFDRVRVPADPDRILHIQVDTNEDGIGARIEIRDVTPPPTDHLPDEESRWRAAGLKPNGELMDPKHME